VGLSSALSCRRADTSSPPNSETISTQDIGTDWPDLEFPSQAPTIAGALVVPYVLLSLLVAPLAHPTRLRRLSPEGKDFIVFLRRGQEQERKWAGNPNSKGSTLEPRTSFKTFTEKVVGRSRAWTDEQVESSAVLLLVYSKFIAVRWFLRLDSCSSSARSLTLGASLAGLAREAVGSRG